MPIEEDLLKLKRSVETLTKKADKLKWEEEQLKKNLMTEYGLSDVKEVQAMAEKLEKEADQIEKEVQAALAEIKTKYKDLLALA